MTTFDPNQYAKAFHVEPLCSVQAPEGKLRDVLAWLRDPPRGVEVNHAKIKINGEMYPWKRVAHHLASWSARL
jgi:hypothetical protein